MFESYAGQNGESSSGFFARWKERGRKRAETEEQRRSAAYEKIEFYCRGAPHLCDSERLRLDLGVNRRYLSGLVEPLAAARLIVIEKHGRFVGYRTVTNRSAEDKAVPEAAVTA
mgnify:CR=1 FL=1